MDSVKYICISFNATDMRNGIIRISIAVIALIALSSWGSTGHRLIGLHVKESFNGDMEFFDSWVPYLAEHSSDADWRKKTDPDEFPKHFIDLDNFPMFKERGRVPYDLDSCLAIYGASFMEDNGFLPWSIIFTYDSLVIYLRNGDYDSGKRMAADLSHYVADGHMPLHLTRNYDGQYSDNKGIHYRYEIGMIDRYEDKLHYKGKPAVKIKDVRTYVFATLYSNYPYVTDVLEADDRARSKYPDIESDGYYRELWNSTSDLTISQFSKASHTLANLLYTAWIEAGRPGTN